MSAARNKARTNRGTLTVTSRYKKDADARANALCYHRRAIQVRTKRLAEFTTHCGPNRDFQSTFLALNPICVFFVHSEEGDACEEPGRFWHRVFLRSP
jgi:hypothetical protein